MPLRHVHLCRVAGPRLEALDDRKDGAYSEHARSSHRLGPGGERLNVCGGGTPSQDGGAGGGEGGEGSGGGFGPGGGGRGLARQCSRGTAYGWPRILIPISRACFGSTKSSLGPRSPFLSAKLAFQSE